ncbi:ABC transporter permease [uncultured Paludibaculum sp.]|uniref:ABC transporter permease n=1 Tax=uncultured Paludibaculum sp. TaxID=1765020 RepID=UPI002AAB4764|nr:ABC transporter permease [uncultured Paludibaculum sp.]
MWNDLRIAVRNLRKTPGFVVAVVATLGLGIALNTTIFSVVNSVWLRPLPYSQPDRLCTIQTRIPSLIPTPIPFSAPDVGEFARQTRAFEQVGAFGTRTGDLTGGGEPTRVKVARITWTLFPMLGVAPRLGRNFSREEDEKRGKTLLLSDGLWRRQFGADPAIVGKTVRLDRDTYTVAGVMPRSFAFPEPSISGSGPADLWLPMSWTAKELAAKGDNFNYNVFGRLKPGITLPQAREDADRVADLLRQTYPQELAEVKVLAALAPLTEEVIGRSKPLLGVLMGAVGLLLLVGCANISNLMLIRGLGRQREVAVRQSMGATRGRVVRQFLAESLILGMAGGVVGLLAAQFGLEALVRLAPSDLPRKAEIGVDPAVLLFTMGLSLLVTIAFGLAPALASSHTDLMLSLRAGSSGSMGTRNRSRLGNWFAVAQVALAMVLLVGAGLLMRTFFTLRGANPGFRSDHLLTASITLPTARYQKTADLESFQRRLLEDLSTQPGIRQVGLSSGLPMEGTWRRIFAVEGNTQPTRGRKPFCAHYVVAGGYFQAMGIPLKEGRLFGMEDQAGKPRVVILSETFAKRFFPGGSAVGKRLKWGMVASDEPWVTVIGVVGDIKDKGLDEVSEPQAYSWWRQTGGDPLRGASIVVSTSGDPGQATHLLRTAIGRLDSEIAVANLLTMEQRVSAQLNSRRFNMYLFSVFAMAATLLAGIGVFGVMAHLVSQRMQEFGVRKALGAQGSDIFRMVYGRGFLLVGLGLAAGLAGSLVLARGMQSMIYGISPNDPLTLAAVCLLLTAAAALACGGPALRALRVEPIKALRWE